MREKAEVEAKAQLDKELAADKQRVKAHKAKTEPCCRRSTSEYTVIRISVDEDLLARSDALARKLKVHRAQLIASGLRAVLAAEKKR